MRLLFVHERFGSLGGAESNIFVTAQELGRRGHEVGIAHGGSSAQGDPLWHQVFACRFALDEAPSPSAIESALAQFRPDVVFLHKCSDPRILQALACSPRPVVRMVHDHDLYCMRSYKYNYFSRRICMRPLSLYCIFPCGACVARSSEGGIPIRWVSYLAKRREIEANKRFHRLVVATAYMREELLRNGFSSDQIEIHAPVPRGGTHDDLPSLSSRNLIVYSGQIIRGKGVDILLHALARVESRFECRIFGDGNQRPQCELLRDRLGLAGKVHFEGFVPQERIVAAYSDASVAVMSSVWPEPFGASGLEAMRCGLPVVAFDAGGISEWLIDGVNGFLVPWMDCDAFAHRVDSLLGDKMLARELGRAGRKFVDERFDFNSYIGGLEDLFHRAAAPAATAGAKLGMDT
jgi:glycosyltransferase involved in cell wall biosynthesis